MRFISILCRSFIAPCTYIYAAENEGGRQNANFFSPEGEAQIWSVLGFDPCNTSIWDDASIMKTDDNKFNQYFICSITWQITGSCFAILPLLLIYLCAQRFIVEGMTAGAAKG